MKKLFILIIAALLLISLCACAPKAKTTGGITVNGTTITVDRENKTLFDGEYTYFYSVSDGKTEIIYPDGSSWWQQTNGDSSYGGQSGDYDGTRYTSGDALQTAINASAQGRRASKDAMLIIVLLGIGAVNLASPHTLWYMRHGWQHKDAEPSTMFLTLNRIGGAATIAVGVILIFV